MNTRQRYALEHPFASADQPAGALEPFRTIVQSPEYRLCLLSTILTVNG